MSIQASYPILGTSDADVFIFKSIGEKGEIWKVIVFQFQVENNKYNLAFGDLKGNDFDDEVISNNNDLIKVISTVAKAIYQFLEKKPTAIIEIHGVDDKRKKLYEFIFKRKWTEIKNIFFVRGLKNGVWEEFSLLENGYQKFEIRLKK